MLFSLAVGVVEGTSRIPSVNDQSTQSFPVERSVDANITSNVCSLPVGDDIALVVLPVGDVASGRGDMCSWPVAVRMCGTSRIPQCNV